MTYNESQLRPKIGETLDDAYYEKLARNIDALKAGNVSTYTHPGSSPTSWTYNGFTYADIDATKFALTLTTHGLPVFVGFSGNFFRPTDGYIALDIIHYLVIGGTPYADPLDRAGSGFGLVPQWCTKWTGLGVFKPYYDLQPGVHEFRVTWALVIGSAANVVTLDGVSKPHMFAYEG